MCASRVLLPLTQSYYLVYDRSSLWLFADKTIKIVEQWISPGDFISFSVFFFLSFSFKFFFFQKRFCIAWHSTLLLYIRNVRFLDVRFRTLARPRRPFVVLFFFSFPNMKYKANISQFFFSKDWRRTSGSWTRYTLGQIDPVCPPSDHI